jgi:hypothetical protein
MLRSMFKFIIIIIIIKPHRNERRITDAHTCTHTHSNTHTKASI